MRVIHFYTLFTIHMALLPSFYALRGERSPFNPVSQASSRGFRARTRSPSEDPIPAILVTQYSLPSVDTKHSLSTVDSGRNVYNRESRRSLPFNRVQSTPPTSIRRGSPRLSDFPNHPKRRNPSKSAGSPKSLLPVTHRSRATRFQIIPSENVFIIPAFQERHIRIDDSDEHYKDEFDGDEDQSVPFLNAPKGRSQSSVFFKIGNSETSYGTQHPSRSRSESYKGKPSVAEAVVSKYNDKPAYAFQFEVSTPQSSSSYRSTSSDPNFGHSETRSGSVTRGKYYVDLPDGRRQIVEYYADETGYHPKITYV